MKKILLVIAELPYPKHKSGTATTLYNLINEWNKCCNISIVYYDDRAIEAENYFFEKGVECTHIDGVKKEKQSIFNAISSIIKLVPRNSFGYDFSKIDTIQTQEFDYVILTGFTSAFFYEKLSGGKINSKAIFFELDCLSLLYKRYSMNTNNFFEKIYYYSQHKFVQRVEKKIYSNAKKIVFVSEVDRDYCINTFNIAETKFANIRNGIELHEFKAEKYNEQNNIINVGFSGIMNYKPNKDAANFIAEEMIELAINKNIRFHIIGKNPPVELKELAKKHPLNLTVTGFLEDIDGYIQEMDIYISPLFTGTGMKNKILQAMNLGVPIICTSISTEGINEVIDGENLIICDSKDAKIWISKIFELANDNELRNEFSLINREIIEKYYTWDNIALDFLEKL